MNKHKDIVILILSYKYSTNYLLISNIIDKSVPHEINKIILKILWDMEMNM